MRLNAWAHACDTHSKCYINVSSVISPSLLSTNLHLFSGSLFWQILSPSPRAPSQKAQCHSPCTKGNKVMKKGLGVIPLFLLLSVSALFTGLPTAEYWDRAYRSSQSPWSVGVTMRRAQVAATRSGDFVLWICICWTFIVTHQLLKK